MASTKISQGQRLHRTFFCENNYATDKDRDALNKDSQKAGGCREAPMVNNFDTDKGTGCSQQRLSETLKKLEAAQNVLS
jgi:hypothetical protein